MFLEELKTVVKDKQDIDDYHFREQTIVWKDPNDHEYELYTSVILERYGNDRFDYAAFNYGTLPDHEHWNSTKAIIHQCRMKPLETPIDIKTFLIDYTIFSPEYTTFTTTCLHHVFR